MNLANTIRMLNEKRSDPPFDVSKADYAGAAKELTQYAKTKGGMDKDDFLSFANRMASIAKKKSPSVMAKFVRDLQGLDTSPREKIVTVMRNNGIKVTMTNRGFQVEELDIAEWEELDEAMVRGKEVFDKTFANRTQADNFAKKNGGRVRQVGRVFYVFKESDEKENDDEEKCPECDEYPCQCDDVKTSESSCGSKKRMSEDFDALFEEAMLSEKMYIVKMSDGTETVPMSKKDAEDYVKKMSYYSKKAGVNTKYKILPEEAIEEAYKTPAEASAYEAGKKAVAKKVSYDDNPNKKGTKEYTAWSKGHNDARAKMIGKRHTREEVELDEATLTVDADPTTAKRVKSVCDDNNVACTMKGKSVVLKGSERDILRVMYKMKFPTNVYQGKIKEDVELDEAREDTPTQVARLILGMGVRQSAPENEILKRIPFALKKLGLQNDKLIKRDPDFQGDVIDTFRGLKEARDPSKSGGSGYDLYHKDFSSAMKHAYDYAKKKFGIEIDPKEIDDKVASGPRKPSAGKTNSYRLKGKDGKKGVQIQVANLDNKKYELNMYKEEVELEETTMDLEQAIKAVVFGLEEKKAPVTKKDDDGDGMDPVGHEDDDVDNDGDKDSTDDYLKNRRKAVSKAIKKDKKDPENDADKKEKEVGKSGKMDKVDTKPNLDEEMSDAEKEKMEKIKAKLDAKKDEFVKKYGDRAKEVIARTAIKMAKEQVSEEISPEIMRIVQKYGASDEVSRLKRYSRETRGLTPDQIRDKNSIIARAKSKAK